MAPRDSGVEVVSLLIIVYSRLCTILEYGLKKSIYKIIIFIFLGLSYLINAARL
jgi:hypothetical protein